jgi:hypothetical protein
MWESNLPMTRSRPPSFFLAFSSRRTIFDTAYTLRAPTTLAISPKLIAMPRLNA